MSFDIDTIETGGQSATATVCEQAELFGAAPERDEFDSRDVWDRDDALDAVSEAFRIMAQGVAPDGFQLADERESLLWGFVNMLGYSRPGVVLSGLERSGDTKRLFLNGLDVTRNSAPHGLQHP